MTSYDCHCNNPAHALNLIMAAQVKWFTDKSIPRERRQKVWRNWNNPAHRNHRSKEYMAELTKQINGG